MKKQLVIIGIVAILVTVGLSGCNQVSNTLNPEKNKFFVGTWKNGDLTIKLFSNGTCLYGDVNGTWYLKENNTLLFVLSNDNILLYSYGFNDNYKSLALTSIPENHTMWFTKQ